MVICVSGADRNLPAASFVHQHYSFIITKMVATMVISGALLSRRHCIFALIAKISTSLSGFLLVSDLLASL